MDPLDYVYYLLSVIARRLVAVTALYSKCYVMVTA
jgi:hypothetical protein